jgi:putative redox protein
MKIELKRIDDAFYMEASNEEGNTVRTDGSPKIGGSNQGMSPMQMLLAALGGCSSIDVISLLQKKRQPLDDIKISVTGQREEGKVPSLFTDIHVHYELFGDLDDKKVESSIRMSMEKLCSVSKIVEKTANITWDYVINPEK